MNGTTKVNYGELTSERPEHSLRTFVEGGSMAEAIGGIAAIVLAIVGLAGGAQFDMLALATIVLGASLILEGGAIAASFRRAMFSLEGTEGGTELGGASTIEFLAGFTGIVLGILALIGVGTMIHLVSVSVIVFGGALLLSSTAVSHLHSLWSQSPYTSEGSRYVAHSALQAKASGQMLIGLSAVILGILALVGMNPVVLNLVALLALGVSVLLSGTAFGTRAMMHKRA